MRRTSSISKRNRGRQVDQSATARLRRASQSDVRLQDESRLDLLDRSLLREHAQFDARHRSREKRVSESSTTYQKTSIDTIGAWQAFTSRDNAVLDLSKPFTDAYFEGHAKTLSGRERTTGALETRDHSGQRLGAFSLEIVGTLNDGFGVGQALYAEKIFRRGKQKIDRICHQFESRVSRTDRKARLDGPGDEKEVFKRK